MRIFELFFFKKKSSNITFLYVSRTTLSAQVGIMVVYSTLNSYPSSSRKLRARGRAYCRLPLSHDLRESWKAELLAIVAGDEVPHHNLVFSSQHHVLCPAHVAVWRTEEERAECLVGRFGVADGKHEVVGFFRILQIAVGSEVFAAEASDVVEGVVADAVAALHHHAEHLGMLADVVAHHEEGGFDVVLVQQIEYPGRDYGDRAVVEGQVNGLFIGIHPPQGAGIEFPE